MQSRAVFATTIAPPWSLQTWCVGERDGFYSTASYSGYSSLVTRLLGCLRALGERTVRVAAWQSAALSLVCTLALISLACSMEPTEVSSLLGSFTALGERAVGVAARWVRVGGGLSLQIVSGSMQHKDQSNGYLLSVVLMRVQATEVTGFLGSLTALGESAIWVATWKMILLESCQYQSMRARVRHGTLELESPFAECPP